MTYVAAQAVVRRYLNERLPEPTNIRAKTDFLERTYSRWAANEIMERLMEEELKLPYHIGGLEQRIPIDLVGEFIDDLHAGWETTTNEDHKFMFSCAVNTAEDILCLLYY